jgi:hypothetical protein
VKFPWPVSLIQKGHLSSKDHPSERLSEATACHHTSHWVGKEFEAWEDVCDWSPSSSFHWLLPLSTHLYCQTEDGLARLGDSSMKYLLLRANSITSRQRQANHDTQPIATLKSDARARIQPGLGARSELSFDLLRVDYPLSCS